MRSLTHGIRAGVRRLFVPALRTPRRTHADLEAELRAHIDARTEYLVARGRSPEDARAEAVRRFGDLDATLDILESSAESRDRQLTIREKLSALCQDVRFVLRGLGRSPAFTAGVIATLTLGLGINSAVFRIADRVLVRAPNGVANPGTLRRVSASTPVTGAAPIEAPTFSFPVAKTVIESGAFASATTYATTRNLRTKDGRDVSGVYVDSGFFHLLGVKPLVGRFFDPREAEPGADVPVAVVSYDYWQRELGGASVATDLATTVGDRTYRIIGVAPRGFSGLDLDPVDVWLPMGVAVLGRAVVNGVVIPWYRTDNFRAMRVIARVPAGADGRASAQAAASLAALDAEGGFRPRGVVLRSINASRDATGNDTTSRLLGRLAGVAVVVLLISCANAANLLLARAVRRRREIAVRLALGGARSRIVRLLVVESVVLGLTGGAAAALAGYWTGEGLRRLLFPDGRWATAAFDDRTMLFTILIALAAGLVAGLAPALQLTNPDLVTALKDNRHQAGRRSHLTRATLVVLQTAFSMALLIGSGLLVRSMQKLNAVNMGFEPERLVTAEVVNPSRFAVLNSGPTGSSRITASEIYNRMRRHPDVRGVALASLAPFGSQQSMGISVPGQPEPVIPPQNGPFYLSVSNNYFSVMGTRLLKGRGFGEGDVLGSLPVALVSESMARLFWPATEPFGSCILLGGGVCAQVIGVVEDIRDSRGGSAPPPRFYLPLSQHNDRAAGDRVGLDSAQAVIVRTAPERAAFVAAAIKASIPAGQRTSIEVINDRVARALRPWRLGALLFSGLGIVALLLACVGVYSVMSYIASERIHELGVRIVLGATASDIMRLVLANGARLVLIGAFLGVVGAALWARLLASLLFGVSPLDPGVYAAAVVILTAIGIVATLVPAMRAMRTDPTVALRAE